ncbi:primosomal protein N', partial [Vibrio parahaemolyticus V-223/04]
RLTILSTVCCKPYWKKTTDTSL